MQPVTRRPPTLSEFLRVDTVTGTGARPKALEVATRRMPKRNRNLVAASLLSAAAVACMWPLFSERTEPEESLSRPGAFERTTASSTEIGGPLNATQLYAVEVDEGELPSYVSRGARAELWVSWDRQPSERPRRERLLPSAPLDRIIPAFTPGGPDAAMLRVEVSQMPTLIHAERLGKLEVRWPAGQPVE
ncbi:MAG: hypothetical protein H0T12_08050 [Actinobacteria bacterium]|nr:hypothetical protein [Actinomycetota bacterium]